MSQTEMERELAHQTGESLATIRRRGFQLMEIPDLKPLVVDWDAIDAERISVLPQRNHAQRAA